MPEINLTFERAVTKAMDYEVGAFNAADPETIQGLINTPAQRKKVGYVNDPDDAGGETKYGVAHSGNPYINIKTLDWAHAKQIYFERYWIAGGCDLLLSRIGILHFDGCTNHGIERASKFLQEVVGSQPDGHVGIITASKITAENEISICNKVCDRRKKFYQDIVAAKPVQVKYLKGWLRRIDEMCKFVAK